MPDAVGQAAAPQVFLKQRRVAVGWLLARGSPTVYTNCVLVTLLAYKSLTPPCSLSFCSPEKKLRKAEHERDVFYQVTPVKSS